MFKFIKSALYRDNRPFRFIEFLADHGAVPGMRRASR
jgi:hypothetical protein